MKSILRLLCAAAVLGLSSCASLEWSPNHTRPAAGVATVAYLESTPEPKRAAAVANVREAAVKLQFVALSENPTAETVRFVLQEVDTEPRWRALADILVQTYEPRVRPGAEPAFRASLVDISEGMLSAVRAYEPSK